MNSRATNARQERIQALKGFYFCRLRRTLALVFFSAWTAAQPHASLNDTGQTHCYGTAHAAVPCHKTATAVTGLLGGQDAFHGRDAKHADRALSVKTGGGASGFDFTAIGANGEAMPSPGGHSCVRDNVTGLWWEVKTSAAGLRHQDHQYAWYDGTSPQDGGSPGNGASCSNSLAQCNTQAYVTAINAAGLCGKSGWRLPTERELLSIVHYGGSGPAIDTVYFPHTPPGIYWTADTYAPSPARAWFVNFLSGNTLASFKTFTHHVRLVRSGP